MDLKDEKFWKLAAKLYDYTTIKNNRGSNGKIKAITVEIHDY